MAKPNQVMETTYGLRLKQAYKHAGLTQVQLASAAGLSQAAISEACRVGTGSAYTVQFARACGVDAFWLATGDGEMEPATLSPRALYIARELDRKEPPEQRDRLYAIFMQLLDFSANDTVPTKHSGAVLGNGI